MIDFEEWSLASNAALSRVMRLLKTPVPSCALYFEVKGVKPFSKLGKSPGAELVLVRDF